MNDTQYKFISFNNGLKILLKEIVIRNFFQSFTFKEFKQIYGYTVVPYNGNLATSFINMSNRNTINIKLNDITEGHSTMIFIIGE